MVSLIVAYNDNNRLWRSNRSKRVTLKSGNKFDLAVESVETKSLMHAKQEARQLGVPRGPCDMIGPRSKIIIG